MSKTKATVKISTTELENGTSYLGNIGMNETTFQYTLILRHTNLESLSKQIRENSTSISALLRHCKFQVVVKDKHIPLSRTDLATLFSLSLIAATGLYLRLGPGEKYELGKNVKLLGIIVTISEGPRPSIGVILHAPDSRCVQRLLRRT